ncbi:DUF6468 domain-containing protein [Temperatibacter marinus]|uniref:DUF6468 domain-containing protein n=1 Tax=Temperatibacter marinus TaxID=1456591 RepID=A0AA52EAF6_9PROT|nr:DUF6468 domain-containing protein [Temperatibacter marinus]WND01682.1 DUF6468 domain-containing protein [Temperatibacter marinus]
MTPLLALVIDGVLAVLLIAAIGACMVVYKKLNAIRSGQDEMKAIVQELNTAVIEAQRSVGQLKHTAVEVEEQLQTQVKKAKVLSDELLLITEAGNNLADRIEQRLTKESGKGSDPLHTVSEKSEADLFGSQPKKKVKSEQKQLLEALKEAR